MLNHHLSLAKIIFNGVKFTLLRIFNNVNFYTQYTPHLK